MKATMINVFGTPLTTEEVEVKKDLLSVWFLLRFKPKVFATYIYRQSKRE